MVLCEACGLRLFEHALHCPRCGRAVSAVDPESAETPSATPSDDAANDSGPDHDRPGDADWDPDETTRFRPVEGSRRSLRNTIALVGLAIALVAAVASLAWLIGQTVGARPVTTVVTSPSPTSTPPSSTPPRNSVICTHEVARSTNTSCAVATRVLSAVRTLGTDLPDTFRVTIVDPQSRKNVTFVCAVKSWIECTGDHDVRVFVRRQV